MIEWKLVYAAIAGIILAAWGGPKVTKLVEPSIVKVCPMCEGLPVLIYHEDKQ